MCSLAKAQSIFFIQSNKATNLEETTRFFSLKPVKRQSLLFIECII